MKKYIFNGCIGGVILACLLIGILDGIFDYQSLMITNENLTENIESQRESYEDLLKQWELDYEDLKSQYWTLSGEKDYLERRLSEVDIPVYDFSEGEVYLIAQCVEAEAGYSDLSQKYVTQVILNRLHSSYFPNRVEEVIYQRVEGVPQFSVAYDGSIDREVDPKTLANVYSVIVNGTHLPEYVLYFYSSSVEENWVNELPVYIEVDGTVFSYKSKEDY